MLSPGSKHAQFYDMVHMGMDQNLSPLSIWLVFIIKALGYPILIYTHIMGMGQNLSLPYLVEYTSINQPKKKQYHLGHQGFDETSHIV